MMKYNYSTGKIERDFVLKKVEGDCHAEQGRTRLIGVMCRNCPHFIRMETFYPSPKEEYILETQPYGTYVFCKFHKKDDAGTEKIIGRIYEMFKKEALSHYDD